MALGSGQQEVEQHPPDEDLGEGEGPFGYGLFRNRNEMEEAEADLSEWLAEELNRAQMARSEQEALWEQSLELYEGVSRAKRNTVPIENAPNLEVTLGAIATDAIYAQMLNLIFNIDPPITIRETGETGQFAEHVKALQRFAGIIMRQELNLRPAVENALLDDVKLGTGIYYVRWNEDRKKTIVDIVTAEGPKMRAVPLEDFFVPSGSYDNLQNERWVAMRTMLTEHELNLRERDLGWDIEGLQPTSQVSRIRQTRERLGRQRGDAGRASDEEGGGLYEIYHFYCLFDIDRDGIDEDLLVSWDKQSRKVLKWRFNPYDRRPFEVMRYQLRQFLFYGLGVMEMLEPFQRGASDLYNHWVLNSMLANARFWVGKHGAVPGNRLRIWPNRYLPLADPRNDLQALQMADTYPSAPAALATTMSLAERRSGVNDLTTPRPSQVLGSRTPGITALSLLQKANERFGPAFDQARLATAGGVKQGLYRYQERLLAGGEAGDKVQEHIMELMGEERGQLVIEILMHRKFDNAVGVELTASSVNQNRQVEQQNSLQIIQTLMGYYARVFELMAAISQPGVPPPVADVGKQIAQKAGEMLDRALRTFDQIRDPQTLLIQVDEAVDQMQQLDQSGLRGLGDLLAGLGGGAGGGAGAAVGPPA